MIGASYLSAVLHRKALLHAFLLSPVASLDAQSVDPRPSCEACLCRAECIRCQLSPIARLLHALHHSVVGKVIFCLCAGAILAEV